MTKIIGLTGGIGSGKTTVGNCFKSANIPVYIADDQAKLIMQSKDVLDAIRRTFGDKIFDNTVLNREKLAEIVFGNAEKLKLLNTIVHPLVKKHFQDWVFKHENFPFVVYEAAILFESGSYKYCDLIITVTAPLEIRIQRVIQRDGTTKDAVFKRIEAQWSDEQRKAKSDFVIENVDLKTTQIEIKKILKFLNIS